MFHQEFDLGINLDSWHHTHPILSTAEQLGIARLLEAEDVTVEQPDEKSIITYVVSYYHYFNEQAKKGIGSNRIGTILDSAIGQGHNFKVPILRISKVSKFLDFLLMT